MLRYMLLAGAAAVAIPCAGLAQVQWSQPLTGENQASSVMNQAGPLDSPTDYDVPFNQAPTGVNAGDYATAQQQDLTRSADVYVPDASDDTTAAHRQQPGNGVSGSQPSGGYYFGNQGDQRLASADQSAAGQQGSYSAPPEGAYSGQPYQGYGGGYYTGQQGSPSAYEGQGQGSYQSPTTGEGLGGEGAYQQGQATQGPTRYGAPPPSSQGQQGVYGGPPANQGYGTGGYYTGQEGAAPNQPYAGQPQGAYGAPPPSQGYGGGGYYTGQQGAVPNQPYAGQPQGAYGAPPPSQGYGGGGYYTGQQGAVPNQPYAGQPQGAYGGQSGYYTGQPNTGQVQTYPGQGGEAYNAPTGATDNAGRPVVVLPANIAGARRYVRKTTVSNVYEIEAARIALQRSQSSDVRDFANRMIQEHQQGLAIITQAAAQAGVPQRPMLDRAHRAMLHRLQRVPADAFDRVYMGQQVVAHMDAAAVQEGYLRNGDNPTLQQAAAQLNPTIQQHLDMAWADTGMSDRLAQQRSTELALLDQNAGRGQTFRGYTVIGPTPGEETNEGAGGYGSPNYRGYSNYGGGYTGQSQGARRHRRHYQGGHYQGGSYNGGYIRGSYNKGADDGGAAPSGQNGAYFVPVAYPQGGGGGAGGGGAGAGGAGGATGMGSPGAGGVPGQGGAGTAGTGGGAGVSPGTSGYGSGAGIPGTSGYGTTTPGLGGTTGTSPGMGGTTGYGGSQYRGYTTPGLGTTTPGTTPGLGTTTPGTTPGVGRTTPGVGTTTPGTPGYYTTPGSPGYTSPGMGRTTPGATGPGGAGTGPGGTAGGVSGPGGGTVPGAAGSGVPGATGPGGAAVGPGA